MNETQVDGIWLVETPKSRGHFPPPPSDPLGPKCWYCEARLPVEFNTMPLISIHWEARQRGWGVSWWVCRHEYGFACPEHGYGSGFRGKACSQCGESGEYT